MWNGKSVSVIFPTYNEEENIRRAVEDFFSTQYVDEVIVVNNNSKDHTVEEAKKTKAKIVTETTQGYGAAIRCGLRQAKGDLVVIAEPDGTFLGRDIVKLFAYSDDFDFVVGTRTRREMIKQGANMGWFLRVGNWAVAKFMQLLFSGLNGPSLSDMGCTMRLIKRGALEKIQDKFTVTGSHFLPEIMILTHLERIPTIEVPLNYEKRRGTSKITGDLRKAFRLGIRMIFMILAVRIRTLFSRDLGSDRLVRERHENVHS